MTEEKEYLTLQLSENPSADEICNVIDEATKTANVRSPPIFILSMLYLHLLTVRLDSGNQRLHFVLSFP